MNAGSPAMSVGIGSGPSTLEPRRDRWHDVVVMRRGRTALVAAVVAAGLLTVSCGETELSAGPTESTGPTQPPGTMTETVTTTVTVTESPEPPDLPQPVMPIHGRVYYGVYLAAAPFGAEELEKAVRRLDRLGIEAGAGEIACDDGAADQLGLPNDLAIVAVYFDRRPDAKAWLDRLDPPPLGLAKVRTYCLD